LPFSPGQGASEVARLFAIALTVFALCVVLGAGEASAQSGGRGQAGEAEQSAGEQPAAGQAPYGTNYAERCEHPQGHDDADLCQQWRAANAAEINARWGIVQAIGLLFTLALSAAATILSLRAVQIAERDLVGRDRPVLSIQVSGVKWERERVGVTFTLSNIGQNPAVIDDFRFGISAGRYAPRAKDVRLPSDDRAFVDPPDAPILPAASVTLEALRTRPFDPVTWRRAYDEALPQSLFLYGVITYRDQIPITRRKLVCISIRRYGKDGEGNEREYYSTLRGRHYDADTPGDPDKPPGWWQHVQWEFSHWWGDLMDRPYKR
jgi:hypothetical protein